MLVTKKEFDYSKCPVTGEDLSEKMTDQQIAEIMNLELDQTASPTPSMIWSFGFDADEVLAVYAALRTYLRALLNQEGEEDLEMLARIIKIMTQIRPSAVKASKALSLEAVKEGENR